MSSPVFESKPIELSYTRLSPSPNDGNTSATPIVFLHGLESCQREFSRVHPYLSKDYDLILVDLPGHSGSRDIPFSLDNALNGISHLISTKITGGKAHIVGLSLGGFISLELARRHPELVLSVFCTGCAPFDGYRKWLMTRPRLLSIMTTTIGKLCPEPLFWYSLGVKSQPGMREECRKNISLKTSRAGYIACDSASMERLSEIRGIKIALVAGGQGDSVEMTREAGKVLTRNNPECEAFVVREAIHWWTLQFPELFAQGVRAWIERSELPKDYEALV